MDGVDERVVVALDMALNVTVLPAFVVGQDDNQPLGQVLIYQLSYVVVVVEVVPFEQVYKTHLYYWEYKYPKKQMILLTEKISWKHTGFELVVDMSSDDEDVVSFESFLTDTGVVLEFAFGVVAGDGERGFEDEFCGYWYDCFISLIWCVDGYGEDLERIEW
jgi:hypothetical protein